MSPTFCHHHSHHHTAATPLIQIHPVANSKGGISRPFVAQLEERCGDACSPPAKRWSGLGVTTPADPLHSRPGRCWSPSLCAWHPAPAAPDGCATKDSEPEWPGSVLNHLLFGDSEPEWPGIVLNHLLFDDSKPKWTGIVLNYLLFGDSKQKWPGIVLNYRLFGDSK